MGTRRRDAVPPADSVYSDMRFGGSTVGRPLSIAIAGAALCTAVVAVSAIQAACLTAPPPELPDSRHRPTIFHDEVVPADVPLVDWPADGTFLANVDVDPNTSFTWAAFLDYDPGNPAADSPFDSRVSVPAPPGGGPAQVSFHHAAPVPDGLCHRVDLVVADLFGRGGPISPSYFYSPEGTGGDMVTWWYTGGLAFSDCSPYAGALPEGGFPPPDAPSDSPPPVPE
jgi:hypothetical protein